MSIKRRRRHAIKIIFIPCGRAMLKALAAILLLFLCVEVLWRLQKLIRTGEFYWAHPPPEQMKHMAYQQHPYAFYTKRELNPEPYPSNSRGFAGTIDYSTPKQSGTFRILFLGGSTTENYDCEKGPNSSWPAQLEQILTERLPGKNIECVNAGVAGYTSAESLSDFCLRCLDFEPDMVVVYHNVNDAISCQLVDGFKSDYSHVRKVKPWRMPSINSLPSIRFLLSYEYARFQLIQAFGTQSTLMKQITDLPWKSDDPFDPMRIEPFKRNIASVVAVAIANNCTPVLVRWECGWDDDNKCPWPHMFDAPNDDLGEKYFQYLRGNNVALKEVASKFDECRYVEVDPFERSHFIIDNMHFTSEGLSLMADRMANSLIPLILEQDEMEGREGV